MSIDMRLLNEKALEKATVDYYNSERSSVLNDAEVLEHCRKFLCRYHAAIAAEKIWPNESFASAINDAAEDLYAYGKASIRVSADSESPENGQI